MTDTEIRQASSGELDVLLELLRECIEGMRRRGIDQWDNVYPDRATVERDIDEATAFVATRQGVPVGMAVLNERQEPEYADVPWLYVGRPAVIHRLMVSPTAEGTGIARALMAHMEAQARMIGFDCICLDAFRHNPRAIPGSTSILTTVVPARYDSEKGEFHCFEKRFEVPVNPPLQRTALRAAAERQYR